MTSMTTTRSTTPAMVVKSVQPTHDAVVQAQLSSLDDTDCYASAWSEALAACGDYLDGTTVAWGGRGKGGRGLARRTFQPKDAIVDNVRLEYLHGRIEGSGKRSRSNKSTDQISNDALLDGATLKILHGHVYALVGRNGCGKSSLLRRLNAGKIPGLSPHLTTLYLPQEIPAYNSSFITDMESFATTSAPTNIITPLDVVLGYHRAYTEREKLADRGRIEELEEELEKLHMSGEDMQEDQQERLETICAEIAELEELDEEGHEARLVQEQAMDALRFFFGNELSSDSPGNDDGVSDEGEDKFLSWLFSPECDYFSLSAGQRKKVLLSVAMFCQPHILLLDEPTIHVDVHGLIRLRRLIARCQQLGTIVLIVSHDVDLINDVATDIIHFVWRKLQYYPGNYDNFIALLQQQGLNALRQEVSLKKKRENMLSTLEHLQKQPVPKRGGAKKKAKAIASHKRRMDRQLNQEVSDGGTLGPENTQLLRKQSLTKNLTPPPIDKAVQFV